MKKYTQEELAFIQGTEFAMDWNFPIPDEDYEKYIELINRQGGDTNNA